MSKKPSDMSNIIAPKGQAKAGTEYPGDEKAPAKPRRTRTIATGKPDASTPGKYQYQPRERRSDSLTLRLAPSERTQLEDLAKRTGAPLTQVVIWGLDALEREIEGDG